MLTILIFDYLVWYISIFVLILFQNKISGLQTKWRSSLWKCKHGRTQIWSDLCNEIALMQLWQLNNYISSS